MNDVCMDVISVVTFWINGHKKGKKRNENDVVFGTDNK